jgi:16S rRNA processing protein RimM
VWKRRSAGAKGRQQGKGMVAQLPGIDDREQAAALIGMDIHVDRDSFRHPAKMSITGSISKVLRSSPRKTWLGRVSHLFATGANDVVVVRDGERERLIPFIQGSYVRSVDLSAGRMVVDWDPEF